MKLFIIGLLAMLMLAGCTAEERNMKKVIFQDGDMVCYRYGHGGEEDNYSLIHCMIKNRVSCTYDTKIYKTMPEGCWT